MQNREEKYYNDTDFSAEDENFGTSQAFESTLQRSEFYKKQAYKFPNRYLARVNIHKNSFMFVNDSTHIRHIKNFKPQKDENINERWNVNISQVYQTIDKHKFINEDQQSHLNNDLDYACSQMLRIFLKTDEIYSLKMHEKKEHINQLCVANVVVIETFKKLMKAVFPKPLSDFKLR